MNTINIVNTGSIPGITLRNRMGVSGCVATIRSGHGLLDACHVVV